MAEIGLLALLRTALAPVAGYEELPDILLPNLPILVVEFGQQRLATTFSLGVPPPMLLMPDGGFPPAVSLHIVLPEGYSYWQPETGTGHYLGGVLEIAQLPELYQHILEQRTAQLAAQPSSGYSLVQLSQYLELLEQIVENGWLLNQNPSSDREKAVALELQRHLSQLVVPELETYCRMRGQVLYAWIERVTYKQNWVEMATDAMWNTVPAWISAAQNDAFEVTATQPIPAVLDGRACLVTAFCQVSKSEDSGSQLVYLPFGICGVSYPDKEIIWHHLRAEDQLGLLATVVRDEQGQPYLGKKDELPSELLTEVSRSYRQLVSLLLERNWLITRYTVTIEERSTAQNLQECVRVLYGPPFSAYYQYSAWQLRGWLRRVTAEELSWADLVVRTE